MEPTQDAGGRLHAVLINGGGSPRINFYSHLEHLRRLLRLLEASDVPADRIAVFSGDGSDPTPDLATRNGAEPDDDWILPRARTGTLRRSIEYADSRIDGVTLRTASRAGIESWFAESGSRLGAGDVLLFYVTDHGERKGPDPTDNTITLWGEELDVEALRSLLSLLDPDVRVVLVMSQCYSGGFAHLILPPDAETLPDGNRCGYFSTTAERPAHGCYAEVSGRPAVGHSHRLFQAMAAGLALPEAQREALVSDATPDVPNSTRGFFMETRLELAARDAGVELASFADERLGEALQEPLAWEDEIRLLDRLAARFGFASPRSLSALDSQAAELEDLSERLSTYDELWERALESLRLENLRGLQAQEPAWRPRLKPDLLGSLTQEQRRREKVELTRALASLAEGEPDRFERMRELHWKAEEAGAARYRAEVRLAVVMRMRSVLLEVAARHYLSTRASRAERESYEKLGACENLALGPLPEPDRSAGDAEPFPTLAEERARLREIVPGWLGIQYRPPRALERSRFDLTAGAAVVSAVLPAGPAAEAGIEGGDILLGPAGAPFSERHGVREWTMQGELGRSHPLILLRDGEEREIGVRLEPYPLEIPSLPGPPPIGSVAPALDVEPLADAVLPRANQPRLLFFWASWCSYCKAAMPEVVAFSQARGIPVVAITDEAPEEVAAFRRRHPDEVPAVVASDRRRRSFELYGVSGTPTFVLLDTEGIVRQYQRGYGDEGLGFEGWEFESAAVDR